MEIYQDLVVGTQKQKDRNWFGSWEDSKGDFSPRHGVEACFTVFLLPFSNRKRVAFSFNTTSIHTKLPFLTFFCHHKHELPGNTILLPWNSMKPKAAVVGISKSIDRKPTNQKITLLTTTTTKDTTSITNKKAELADSKQNHQQMGGT